MSLKTLFALLLGTLANQAAYSQLVSLGPIKNIHFKDIKTLPTNPNEADVLKFLKSEGIAVNEKSEIKVHEEANIVNLSCFSCVVLLVPEEFKLNHSYNERTIQ